MFIHVYFCVAYQKLLPVLHQLRNSQISCEGNKVNAKLQKTKVPTSDVHLKMEGGLSQCYDRFL